MLILVLFEGHPKRINQSVEGPKTAMCHRVVLLDSNQIKEIFYLPQSILSIVLLDASQRLSISARTIDVKLKALSRKHRKK